MYMTRHRLSIFSSSWATTMQMELLYSKPGTLPPSPGVDQEYLREVVSKLSFPMVYGTPANAEAEKVVAEEFRGVFGKCLVLGKARNVCAGDVAQARILIGAHYDSVTETPGADDNASAVAVMLAVARSIGPRRDVMYVAFNGEECNLAGSLEFVDSMASEMKRLEQVHILEMVG
jgi:hypothetical protein